jgi:sugar phosphate isomerase/epimerase
MSISDRLGCSTISFRHLALPDALAVIEELGFADISRVAAELTAAAERASAYGVQVWVESLHLHRLCHSLPQAIALTAALSGTAVGVVMDFSHVVASGARPERFAALFGDRIRHVHLRDATPGNIHSSIGNGTVDFAAGLRALESVDYAGHFALELETRDITDADRPAATAKAADYISSLLHTAPARA